MQPGIYAPSSFPIRDPRDKAKVVGRIANGPRYADDMGGLTGPNKWPAKTDFKVEAATRVSAGSSPAERI